MPTPRQLAVPAAAAGSLVLAGLALAVASDALPAADAVVIAGILLLLGVQALVLLSVRRADGKALRADTRMKRCEAELSRLAASTERLGVRLDEITGLLGERDLRHGEDLRAILASLGEDRLHTVSLREEIGRLAAELRPASPGTGAESPLRPVGSGNPSESGT
ncbi:hypothetical protein [Planomonospora algeriensis]